jgi:DNA-binding NtrC family response regulator
MTTEQERILVVDDEEAVRNLLQRILEETGYTVTTAANGQEAIYKLSLGEAKIMLLDMKMPGMSGIEVLQKLEEEWPKYCILMVTAVTDFQTAVDALKLGACDYITKPFDREDVKQKLIKAIQKHHRLSQDKKRYDQLQISIVEQTSQMQEQFAELVNSLSRENKLVHQLAAGQPDGGKAMLSKLPKELQEPISSVDEYRDALLRILRRA